MKTTETLSTSTQHHQSQTEQPFFHKEAGDYTFFSNAKSNVQKKPFFDHNQPIDSGIQTIQTKLTIGQPGDQCEVEVDAMADKVVQKLSKPEADPTTNTKNVGEKTSLQKKEESEELKTEDEVVQEKPIFESKANTEEKAQTKVSEETSNPALTESSASKPPSLDNTADIKAGSDNLAPTIQSLTSAPPIGLIQRQCEECQSAAEKEVQEKPELQKKPIFESAGGSGDDENINCKAEDDSPASKTIDLQTQLNSSKGGGQALDKNTQSSMESAFSADFGNVRVHTDSNAIEMNQDLGAQAFTHGSDIYFNEEKYNTNSPGGKRLLAHELTHVVQQKFHRVSPSTIQREMLHDRDGALNYTGQTGESQAQRRLNQLIEIRPDRTARGPWRIFYRWDSNQSWTEGSVPYQLYSRAEERLPQLMRVTSEVVSGTRRWYVLKNSILRSDRRIFSDREIRRMKSFFIRNASNRGALACINTVRAGIGVLIYDSPSISGQSCPPSLRQTTGNTMEQAMALSTSQGISQHITPDIYFEDPQGRRARSGNEPMTLEESVWDRLTTTIGNGTGWSVFGLSLCDGNHSVIISVDHRNISRIRMYWTDQTHHHPVISGDQIGGVSGEQHGWERMARTGGSQISSANARGLDEYIRYAVRSFWFGSGVDSEVARSTRPRTRSQNLQIVAEQQRLISEESTARARARRRRERRENQDIHIRGHCIPVIRIWRIQHAQTSP